MLHGFMEGLVGIQDKGRLLDTVRLCPRWAAAGLSSAEASLCYDVSGAQFSYHYEERANELKLEIKTQKSDVHLHQLLPENAAVDSIQVAGASVPFEESVLGASHYVDCQLSVEQGTDVIIRFK